MTDQEQYELHLLLAEYYAKEKGWKIFVDQNSYFTAIKYKVPPDYQGETTYVPAHKLTDLNWLFELLDMLNIQYVIIDPTAEGTWACGISVAGRDWFKAIAITRELALAICLGKIIKEKK